ncbi:MULTISPECIES: DUF4019 domain-containing protein [unclassified Caballeronia]|uniref:DUF4019 domain-containing protein n=1 Tax=unclassified Caballeronia TaxID=2646786 RepID=UPI0020290425|nr:MULTISPECIES: DUF4019 domain-containing protein [unclassified Caballeronia]
MKASFKLFLFVVSLISFAGACQAQQAQQAPQTAQAPHALTREQQAQLDKQDQDIAQVASTIVKMVDENKAGDIWDLSSPLARKVITRDDFVKKVTNDRAALGAAGMRMPMGVRHLHFDGTGNMPAGSYITVTFDTQFSQAQKSSREIVTFILDPDNSWRFAGYSVR